MNEKSSRSHAIFQIQIEQEIIERKTKLIGKLFLVDLAGSESVNKIILIFKMIFVKFQANSGGDLKEGGAIKQGLFALGRVINALHDKVQ